MFITNEDTWGYLHRDFTGVFLGVQSTAEAQERGRIRTPKKEWQETSDSNSNEIMFYRFWVHM